MEQESAGECPLPPLGEVIAMRNILVHTLMAKLRIRVETTKQWREKFGGASHSGSANLRLRLEFVPAREYSSELDIPLFRMRHATCDMRQNEKIGLGREGIYIIYSIYTYLYYIFLAFLPPFYQNVACRMSHVASGQGWAQA